MQRNQHVRFGGGRLETQVKLCAGRLPYFLLFAPDKPSLHRWKQAIIEFLVSLRLSLHERQAAIFPVSTGIPFLGWRIYPDYRRLKRCNGVAFQRRLSRMFMAYAEGKLSKTKMDASVQSWVAHASHGQTWGLRRSLLSKVYIKPFSVET